MTLWKSLIKRCIKYEDFFADFSYFLLNYSKETKEIEPAHAGRKEEERYIMNKQIANSIINGDWTANITVNGKDAYFLRKNMKRKLVQEIMHNRCISNGNFEMNIWKFYENGEHLGERVAINFFSLDRKEQQAILEAYLMDGYEGGFFDDYHLSAA